MAGALPSCIALAIIATKLGNTLGIRVTVLGIWQLVTVIVFNTVVAITNIMLFAFTATLPGACGRAIGILVATTILCIADIDRLTNATIAAVADLTVTLMRTRARHVTVSVFATVAIIREAVIDGFTSEPIPFKLALREALTFSTTREVTVNALGILVAVVTRAELAWVDWRAALTIACVSRITSARVMARCCVCTSCVGMAIMLVDIIDCCARIDWSAALTRTRVSLITRAVAQTRAGGLARCHGMTIAL